MTPVVDDSDMSDSDSSDKESESGSRQKASFDDILTEADNFATQIERKTKRSTAVARVSLEDELRNLSAPQLSLRSNDIVNALYRIPGKTMTP